MTRYFGARRQRSTTGRSCRLEERTASAILAALDFDFFELLDSVTIARSRKHIETFYDTKDIGTFPERLKPLSSHCPLTQRTDVIGFNDIFNQLSLLKLAVYAPVSYILPSRIKKYEDMYDTEVASGGGKLKQADREKSLQALMTVNLLKRLESSVASETSPDFAEPAKQPPEGASQDHRIQNRARPPSSPTTRQTLRMLTLTMSCCPTWMTTRAAKAVLSGGEGLPDRPWRYGLAVLGARPGCDSR